MDPALVRRIVRYGIAGLIATAIYMLSVLVLVEHMEWPPIPAAVGATLIVIFTSYRINRAYVFDTNRSHRSAFTRFVVATLLTIGLNAGLMHVATGIMSWPYIVGAALTTVVVPPVNFVVNYFWAFKNSEDVDEDGNAVGGDGERRVD